MHEAFVKHTCARSKSKLAVKAIMNAVQQPENVTEENLKHMPVAMFALFKVFEHAHQSLCNFVCHTYIKGYFVYFEELILGDSNTCTILWNENAIPLD